MAKIKLPLGNKAIEDEPKDELRVDPNDAIDPNLEKKDDGDQEKDINSDAQDAKEAVVIDDKEYNLDEEGNAVLEDGSVFKTKEELEALENADTDEDKIDVSIVDLETLSGIEIKDSDGNKVDFEFTLDGLAKREQAIKQLGLKEGVNTAITDFFNANPDLYKAYLYKSKKGTLEGFSNEPFYKSIQVDTENEDQLMNFVIEAEIKKGSSPDRAKSIANFFKAENKLEEEGAEAHKYLVSLEEKEFNEFEKTRTENEQRELENQKKYYGTYFDENGKEVVVDAPGSVYDKVVKKGQFGNFVIPQDGVKVKSTDGKTTTLSRKQIFDYISRPVTKEGYTQAQLDDMKRLSNMDTLLYQYMMNLTGSNINQLLERRVLEEKSKVIKKRLQTKSTSDSKPNTSTSKHIKVPVK